MPLGTFEPAKSKDGWGWKAWQHHWAQASSGTIVPVGTQPKRQNPSKIHAKRVAIWSAEPVPFGTFEPAKIKDGWGSGWKAWHHHWELAQASSGTKVPVGTQPKRQTPSRIQAQRRAIWSAEPLSPVSTQPKRQNPSKIQAKRVASWSAEPVPFGTFEPAKSTDGWDWNAWQHHWELAQASSGTKVPVGTQPKRKNPARFRPI